MTGPFQTSKIDLKRRLRKHMPVGHCADTRVHTRDPSVPALPPGPLVPTLLSCPHHVRRGRPWNLFILLLGRGCSKQQSYLELARGSARQAFPAGQQGAGGPAWFLLQAMAIEEAFPPLSAPTESSQAVRPSVSGSGPCAYLYQLAQHVHISENGEPELRNASGAWLCCCWCCFFCYDCFIFHVSLQIQRNKIEYLLWSYKFTDFAVAYLTQNNSFRIPLKPLSKTSLWICISRSTVPSITLKCLGGTTPFRHPDLDVIPHYNSRPQGAELGTGAGPWWGEAAQHWLAIHPDNHQQRTPRDLCNRNPRPAAGPRLQGCWDRGSVQTAESQASTGHEPRTSRCSRRIVARKVMCPGGRESLLRRNPDVWLSGEMMTGAFKLAEADSPPTGKTWCTTIHRHSFSYTRLDMFANNHK